MVKWYDGEGGGWGRQELGSVGYPSMQITSKQSSEKASIQAKENKQVMPPEKAGGGSWFPQFELKKEDVLDLPFPLS